MTKNIILLIGDQQRNQKVSKGSTGESVFHSEHHIGLMV